MDFIQWVAAVLRLPLGVFTTFFYLMPVLPHLPAFFYGIYTQTDQPDRGVPGQKENYLLALFISAPLSFFVTMRTFLAYGLPPLYPVWYIEVLIVAATLLIPTFHAYSEYEKYGDVREVVLLILIYAPWVQFVRTFVAYMRFV